MKKAVVTILLSVFILVNFTFIILRLGARGSEDNFFNLKLRSKIATYPVMRKIINLHFDGDAKSDYLGNRYSKILVEVDSMANLSLPRESLDQLIEKMKNATGKEVSYLISDSRIPYERKLTRERTESIESLYRNIRSNQDTASLYLLYITESEESPDEVGSTFKEDGIVLFAEVLKEFTKSNPDTLNNYLESTALHEFGHQLGLPHNNFSDCLMQTYVDEGFFGYTSPESVIVDFCEYEQKQIQAAKF